MHCAFDEIAQATAYAGIQQKRHLALYVYIYIYMNKQKYMYIYTYIYIYIYTDCLIAKVDGPG